MEPDNKWASEHGIERRSCSNGGFLVRIFFAGVIDKHADSQLVLARQRMHELNQTLQGVIVGRHATFFLDDESTEKNGFGEETDFFIVKGYVDPPS
jgi:hypothetical protein